MSETAQGHLGGGVPIFQDLLLLVSRSLLKWNLPLLTPTATPISSISST